MPIQAKITKCNMSRGNLDIEVDYYDSDVVVGSEGFFIADNPLVVSNLKNEIAAKVKRLEERKSATPVSDIRAGEIISSAMLEQV